MTLKDYMWSMGQVLKRPRYLVIGVVFMTMMVILAAWLPNLGLVGSTIGSSELEIAQKLKLLTALVGGINTNFQPEARVMVLLSAFLAGIQISMVSYYFGQKIKVGRGAGAGIVGIVSSLLGVGCASCGSVILTSFLGLGTSSLVLSSFPLKGTEFAILGLLIILASLIITTKKLYETQFCKIRKT